MVHKLLATRVDIFPDYTQEAFEKEFLQFFNIVKSEEVGYSERTLYLMRNKSHA
jgi:hypothetical protein